MTVRLLLVLLTVVGVDSSLEVSASLGQDVTLSCRYDKKLHGLLNVCWTRGKIFTFGCSNKLIASIGDRVEEESRTSSRYQLLGHLDRGDVSLTILNVTEKDAGEYGCRVNIPGWFNDQKHHFLLTLEPVLQTTTVAAASTERDTQAPGHVTSAVFTEGSSVSVEKKVQTHSGGGGVPLTLLCTVVSVVFVTVTVSILMVVIAKRNKLPQQVLQPWVQFNSSLSTLQLHSREAAPENVYQLEDVGEYQVWP